MRTTIDLQDDALRAVEELRRAEGLGLSEAVNELIRRALLPRPAAPPFRQATRPLGLRIDVSNVADALDALEGPTAR